MCLSACRERCGVIKIRQPGVQRHWRERETVFQNGPAGLRRLTRKRYIDLGNECTHTDKVNLFCQTVTKWICQIVCSWDNNANLHVTKFTKAESTQSISTKKHTVNLKWSLSKLYSGKIERECFLQGLGIWLGSLRLTMTFVLCLADEAGPGPVKSKYDALDFDTLLKEAQKSLHRWQHSAPDWPALVTCSEQHPSDYTALHSDRPLSTSMQGNLAKCLHFYHWNKVTIRTLLFFKFLSPEDTA